MADSLMNDPKSTCRIAWLDHARKAKRQFGSLLTSLLLHIVVFIVLAIWLLPVVTESWKTPIDAKISESDDAADISALESAFQMEVKSSGPQAALMDGMKSLHSQFSHQAASLAPIVRTFKPTAMLAPNLPSLNSLSDAELLQRVNISMSSMPIHQHRGETRLAEADSAQSISAGLAGQLKSIANDGDAVVVWLLDQSLSMQMDLKVLSVGLKDTLTAIEEDKKHKMSHYVVAFGDNVKVVQDATPRGMAVAKAIYNLPPSPSGVENTFQATEWTVNNLFLNRKWAGRSRQMLLVIWTDESGDDILRLENTIQLCRQANVRVDIIGPSAVLGSQRGYTKFLHPEDNRVYYLPVTRGPDSAFREKPYLPYWHRGVPVDYDESLRGPYQGTSPQWYGGSDMKSMLSGFSPYALTRLARETGGIYTLFDRPGDRAPFPMDAISDYMPDYRHIAEIDAENREYPLRMAVQAVAEITWQEDFSPPRLNFRPGFGGQSSNEFRNKLKNEITSEMARCEQLVQRIQRCLTLFTGAKIDDIRAKDRSPRWRAWTDLTVGRLLTLSVRLREYILTLQDIAANDFGQLGGQTNSISLTSTTALRGGEATMTVAAEAKRYLDRCIEENQGTPWQFLAERELQHPVGLLVQESYVPAPKFTGNPPPPRQQVKLPNL